MLFSPCNSSNRANTRHSWDWYWNLISCVEKYLKGIAYSRCVNCWNVGSIGGRRGLCRGSGELAASWTQDHWRRRHYYRGTSVPGEIWCSSLRSYRTLKIFVISHHHKAESLRWFSYLIIDRWYFVSYQTGEVFLPTGCNWDGGMTRNCVRYKEIIAKRLLKISGLFCTFMGCWPIHVLGESRVQWSMGSNDPLRVAPSLRVVSGKLTHCSSLRTHTTILS